MEKKPFGTIVYIGRFQPFHNGHYETLKLAKTMAHQIIVLVGSAFKPRTIKNPFTFAERERLIRSFFPGGWKDLELTNWVQVLPLEDQLYDDTAWAINVQNMVGNHTVWHTPNDKIGIIGLDKDESSFYLKMFPQWEQIGMRNVEKISGTTLRDNYFTKMYVDPQLIPDETWRFMNDFSKTTEYVSLCKEYEFIKNYKAAWSTSPYPPTFVTVDAVVFYCGHVLLVKRKAEPGKGQWALPGGFIHANERIKDACVRELYEETKLGLYPSELLSMYRSNHVFDYPGRSLRGRTITHAYHYSTIIPNPRLEGKLPKVKGLDDAEVAKWFPLNQVMGMSGDLFEDHLDIIKNYI